MAVAAIWAWSVLLAVAVVRELQAVRYPSSLMVWCDVAVTAGIAVLERAVYSEAEAARLLAVSQGTLHYWLEGGTRRNVTYKPVLRIKATGVREVTWGEFVEAGLLREYRQSSIPMPQLRTFISHLRDALGIPYPLAHRRPWVTQGAGLLYHAQAEAGLDPEFWLVSTGQGLLTPAGSDFVERITWNDEHVVGRYRPHDDRRSPVVLDPSMRFGRPSIRGISTMAVYEQAEDGAEVAEIADLFGLSAREVRWAVAYESTKAA